MQKKNSERFREEEERDIKNPTYIKEEGNIGQKKKKIGAGEVT